MWVKENTILPISNYTDSTNYEFAKHIELKVYELREQAITTVYQAQEKVLEVVIRRENDKIYCNIEGNHEPIIRFVNCTLKNVKGGELSVEGRDSLVKVNGQETEVVCEV